MHWWNSYNKWNGKFFCYCVKLSTRNKKSAFGIVQKVKIFLSLLKAKSHFKKWKNTLFFISVSIYDFICIKRSERIIENILSFNVLVDLPYNTDFFNAKIFDRTKLNSNFMLHFMFNFFLKNILFIDGKWCINSKYKVIPNAN